MSSLIWVISHLARDTSSVKMSRHKPEHMTIRILLPEVRVEVHLLRIRMFRDGCTCKSSDFQKLSDCLSLLLKFIQFKEREERKARKARRRLPL